MKQIRRSPAQSWLNRTVIGIALASLFSDWSHEIATAILPAFLGSLGVAAAWLGFIEGISDGLSSFVKLGSGFYTDGLPRRKPIALAGYLITAFATASIGLATTAWHVLMARATAWLGRGVRTPVRKALLTSAVDRAVYGRAFGFERAMDTLGAIVGPLSALWLLAVFPGAIPLGFCTYAPAGIGSDRLNRSRRPGKDANAGTARLLRRTATCHAQGISTVPGSRRHLRSRRICPHPSHPFGYPAINAASWCGGRDECRRRTLRSA
jgi:MFS family permease